MFEKKHFRVYHKAMAQGAAAAAASGADQAEKSVPVCVQLQFAVLLPFIERWWRAKDGQVG